MESTANAIEMNIGGKGSSPSSWMQLMEKGRQKKTVNTVTFQANIAALESGRRSGGHPPAPWGAEFIKSFTTPYSYERHGNRLEEVKESARKLLVSTKDAHEQLDLINTLQRLGVAYHFENEIKHILSQLVDPNIADDLRTVALQFRLLRQNGIFISTDLFNKFIGKDGKFNENLGEDVSGILSLYEASFLGMPDEDVVDEARNFSVKHLETALTWRRLEMGDDMAKQIEESLEMEPLHWRLLWVEARNFIDIYGRDEKRNLVLLELAKLNYNILQSVYMKELQELAEWWKGLNFKEKLPFARDRLFQPCFWAMGCSHEVQFYKVRRNLAKLAYLFTIFDDIVDTYGLVDELEKYKDALIRWDLGAIEELPEYMKPFYIAMYNHVTELANDALEDKGIDILPYIKKLWLRYVEASIQETKWIYSGYCPTEDEYLQNAWITIGGLNSLNYAIVGVLGQNSMNKLLSEFINQNFDPDIVYVPALIMRLLNDLSTDKVEMERGEALNLITCYMMQEGVSEKEARDRIKGMHQNLRKKLNKLVIQYYSDYAPCLADVAVTVMRSTHRIYLYRYDWFAVLNKADEVCVMSSFFQPIPMEKDKRKTCSNGVF